MDRRACMLQSMGSQRIGRDLSVRQPQMSTAGFKLCDRKAADRSRHPAHPLWWKGCGSSDSKVAGDAAGSGRHKMLLRVSGGDCASNEGRLSEGGDIFTTYFNRFQNVLLKTNIPVFSSVSCWLKGGACMLSCV